MDTQAIIKAIDTFSGNRGVSGADWLASPHNVAIVTGPNVSIFEGDGNGHYEAHLIYRAKGRAAIDAARNAFQRMFTEYGAQLIYGLIAASRLDAKLVARWAGAKFSGKRMEFDDHEPCDLYIISKDMWR